MNQAVIRWSTNVHIGSEILAARFEQVVEEFAQTNDHWRMVGSLQVLAAQAVRELDVAEKKSLDPADVLAREDARLAKEPKHR